MDPTGWASSADAWIERVDAGDWLRENVLDKSLLQSIGEVRGLDLLDFGCGEGRFSRMVKARGAKVTGFDYIPALAARARKRDPEVPVAVADGRSLPFRGDSFDRVVSCLVLLDIEGFECAVDEAVRVLRPGGLWLDAHITPLRTASDTYWVEDKRGDKHHVPVERYFPARKLRLSWAGIEIVNHHRPLEEYLKPFLQAGLLLREFREPLPEPGPDVGEHDLRVPFAMTTLWQKPR